MQKTFHNKLGVVTRELNPQELKDFAARGDTEAKREILKQVLLKATSSDQKLNLIIEFLLGEVV